MRKYMIRCDMEGVSGVVSYEQTEPGKPEYVFGCMMFMEELLSLLSGLRDGGADEVVIYDEHFYGRNIDISELPDYARAICGKPPYRPDWAGGLDSSFAGVILLGFHSKFGTPNACLPHSYEHDIKDIRLNGISVGEIGIEAAVAGDFNVPVQLVTGDSHGAAEAEALLRGIETVVVKEGIDEGGALCYPLSTTTCAIRKAAKKIVETPPAVIPYKCGETVTLEVEFNDTQFRKQIKKLFAPEMSDISTIVIKGTTVTEVWAAYLQKKIEVNVQNH